MMLIFRYTVAKNEHKLIRLLAKHGSSQIWNLQAQFSCFFQGRSISKEFRAFSFIFLLSGGVSL
jgi:hypothetical protein